jgi:hypothetical protein
MSFLTVRAFYPVLGARELTAELGYTTCRGSCTSSVRVNTRGLPSDRQKDKKFYMRRSSWPPRGPLLPGDALDAGRADARCLLRLPPRAASHPSACSYPRWLGPWRHPIQQDLSQGPDMIGHPGRHRWRTGAPLLDIGLWRILCMAQIEHKRISKYAMVANRTRT